MVESEGLEKNMVVGAGTNSAYKAISESSVLNVIKPLLKKHGIVIFPVGVEIKEEHSEYQGKYGMTQRFLSCVHAKYKIVDADTGEFEILETVGYGTDSQDKGSGQAMTYAYKTLIQKTFCLFSGEDTDNKHSEEINKENSFNKTTQQAKPQQPTNTSSEKKLLSQGQINRLYAIAKTKGRTGDQVQAAVKSHYKIEHMNELTKQQYDEVVKKYEAMADVEEVKGE